MTQTFTKSARYALGLLFLGSLDMASATHRIDEPTAYGDAVLFAKTLPYATGMVLGSDNSVASAIFLNETTALSCAHAFAGRGSAQNTIIAANKIELLYTPSGDFDCATTLTHAIRSGKPSAIVDQIIPYCTFSQLTPKGMELWEITPDFLREQASQWENPEENIFPQSDFVINGGAYKCEGPDLAVLKLKTPLALTKKPISLAYVPPEELVKLPSYSFGYFPGIRTSDGSVNIPAMRTPSGLMCSWPLNTISTYNLRFSRRSNIFYTSFRSSGGMDDRFICDGLPPATSQKFIGLIAGGMSGGPLLFEAPSGEYILGGLNSASRHPSTNALLQNAIARIESYEKLAEEGEKGIFLKTKRMFMSFLDQNLPIYNAFQAVTPELIEKIHLTMTSGASSDRAPMGGVVSASPDVDALYDRALRLRDGKIPGHTPKKSKELAAEIFLDLAKKGFAKAMHNYAMIQDQKGAHDVAYAWFQKAAALGLDASKRNCARMEASGKIQKQL